MAERTTSSSELASLCDRNFQKAVQALSEREKEVDKLREQQKEILHINKQWDDEYKELQARFEQYGVEMERTQQEHQDIIGRLRHEKEQLKMQIRTLKSEKDKLDKKLNDLRVKYDSLRRQNFDALSQISQLTGQLHNLEISPPSSPLPNGTTVYRLKIGDLEEQNAILKAQLQAFKEDFEAERRDKERVSKERETERLRYEADIASLKIQLDRSSSEMMRFKSEAKRLAEQLRLKKQEEEEIFKKHLERQGYTVQYPGSKALDSYVENDRQTGIPGYHSNMSAAYPRKPSLTYHTHMGSHPHISDHPVPLYNPAAVRRYSSEAIDPSLKQKTYSSSGGMSDDEPPKSVSPQIHRMGRFALYSRDTGGEDDDVVSNSSSLKQHQSPLRGNDDVERDHTPPRQ